MQPAEMHSIATRTRVKKRLAAILSEHSAAGSVSLATPAFARFHNYLKRSSVSASPADSQSKQIRDNDATLRR